MTKEDLKISLTKLEIKPNNYSLYGNLIPDTVVLTENNANYEVFYFDEKGNKNDIRKFFTEDEACLHILNKFIEAKIIEIRFNLNT